MDYGISGKTAVIPGSTSGLGLATAKALAAEGANVVIAGRRKELAEQEAAGLPSAIGVEYDLSAPDAGERLLRAATERFGQVDILVLNGGGPPPGTASELDSDALETAMRASLFPLQALVSGVLPGMLDRGWGRILAVGSVSVQQPLENMALSNITRAALAGYLKTLAGEVAGKGVTVNMVLPGRIDTDRIRNLDRARSERSGMHLDEIKVRAEANIPVGRAGTPDEFAAMVAFLASAAASYVTGEQVRVDGGVMRAF